MKIKQTVLNKQTIRGQLYTIIFTNTIIFTIFKNCNSGYIKEFIIFATCLCMILSSTCVCIFHVSFLQLEIIFRFNMYNDVNFGHCKFVRIIFTLHMMSLTHMTNKYYVLLFFE